jgi:tetratricopeptide (TPR) repeat protein/tRNA A-37 threonylcarbamoyl transferase component Bud32
MEDIRPRLQQALASTYTFERELGGGGMSRTYLVEEVALKRRVVVKVLAPELLAGISVERFRREVLLAAGLQHPHVVPVLSTGDVDGIPWFTMPYVDGDSLRHRLGRGGVGIGEAVGILRDVARALAYAHAHGIVHRDIKPDNVLLSGGSATVTDFGIAKAINAARTGGGQTRETLTQVGTSIGTPAYMAPEQAAGDPTTDFRADLYAFGVMAFEVLAGRTPFVATTPTKLLAAHMSEQPPDLLTLRPDCPPALAALVMRCLEKDPDARPRGAAELVQVLDTVTSSGGGAAVPEILRGGPIRLGRAVALWAAATAIVTLTAWAAREAIGLPDWVLPGAAGVMLAGLPVLLFTAYVQRTAHRAFTATPHRTPAPQGTMATLAMKASPHVSWRRAWLGGALAVSSFAILVIAFMVMRAMGIGPMASLRGTGAFGDRERIMIADFRSPPSDTTLGGTVAEALRTDLAQSSALEVLTRSAIREALTLMQRSPEEAVPYALAREIATREGAKAVLDGSISQLGGSYVITARLASALDGTDLATFREEAASEDELLPALGRLSKEVRTRAGESLKSIRASNELERVTTPSLPALRKYVEGSRLADEEGEIERGMELLREAVALDTAFAMAWRKLAVLLNNEGRDREGMIAAISTAYRHRTRLTEMERLLTEGFYFTRGPTPDRDRAIAAYEEAAQLDSLSTSALNNAAVILGEKREYERAEELYRQVVELPHTFGGAFTNLLQEQIRNKRSPAALDSTVAGYREKFGTSNDFWEAEWYAAWGKGDVAAADSIARAMHAASRTPRQAIRSGYALASTSEMRGHIADASRWTSRSSQALYRVQPTPGNLFSFALDTAYYETMYGTKRDALAALARGRARVPMSEIPPSERPWDWIKIIGAYVQEPGLVREARAGWERDQSALSNDAAGRRANFDAYLAFAENRWADVITAASQADQRFAIDPRGAHVIRGFAYQALGQADSAIDSFERFLSLADPQPEMDGVFRAQVLQRLGELHEGKGEKAKAIDYYSRFTELWAEADASLQPRVREIRDRITKLQRDIG